MSTKLNIFGPVPSRRLGQSLGIVNVVPRACTYSCVYCQIGRTPNKTVESNECYSACEIVSAVEARLQEIRRQGGEVDCLSLVPDGEPTLDPHLGETIEQLRPLGVRIAVITNGSLIWRREVREGLRKADWVSLKVDTVIEEEWRRINRPHPSLHIETVLQGMLEFSASFEAELVTETMLLAGLNDSEESIAETAMFVEKLRPSTAYLGIPTRPTAESWAKSTDEECLNRAYQLFVQRVDRVELLTGGGEATFGTTGDAETDLIGITSVHPMSEEAVLTLLDKNGGDWGVVRGLIDRGVLAEIEYEGQKFYVRRLPSVGKAGPGS